MQTSSLSFLQRRLINNLLLIFLLPLLTASFNTFAQPIAFCGNSPTHTAVSTIQDSIYFDRFGNTYDRVVLDAQFESLSGSRSIIGYFDLRFENVDPNYIPVIENVFEYLSNTLQQRTITTGCSDVIAPSQIRIMITESSEVDDPQQATGSPEYFIISNRSNCDEVVADRISMKMNGGLNDVGVDGMIFLNDEPDNEWYLGTGTPSSTQVDLFTIVLHEALHVFGFAPRLTSSGNALGGTFSLWDQLIFTSTGYVNGGPSLNLERVLFSDCEENCWVLNEESFKDASVFTSELETNCSTGGILDFVFGDDAIAPLLGGSGDVGYVMSHLNETCNGQNLQYVMLPGISLGETKRIITNPELNILCRLGYQTERCEDCFLTVLPEDHRYLTFESCCETFISACEDQTLFIDFDDLLCNDNSNELTEITY
jgi:hypothetical protein